MVAKGFQETKAPQSDSPTVNRESVKMFSAVIANNGWNLIRKVDISASFLQSDKLTREVFVRLPKDVCDEGKIWKLLKPLYGLNDASRRFWLKVKSILESFGMKKIEGDEAYYVKQDNGNWLEMFFFMLMIFS